MRVNEPMNSSHQSLTLLNIEPENKLSYISIINSEPEGIENNQQPLKKIGNNVGGNSCVFSDYYDKDESKSKGRKRNPENWKQNIRKRNKNKGLEYVKANGEICERKKLGPPCSCREKCYLKIGMEACEKIFQNFWKLGDHALQNAYIAGCVRIFLPKHCYKKDGIPSRRFFSRNFHVTVNGVDTEVCKQAFLNMHAISNGRLDRLLKKKQEIGNTGFDERGRHNNKVNKIPLEKIKEVHNHIDSVRQKAGYTGKRKPKKVEILPGLLNIRSMYRSYREEMLAKGLAPVCEYRYRKIFHTDFHLDFGKTVVPNAVASDMSQSQQQHQQQPQQQQQQQPQQHSQDLQSSSQTQTVNQTHVHPDKLMVKTGDQYNNIKKVEAFTDLTLQNININGPANSHLKSSKQTTLYSELVTHETKDYQIRGSNSTPFVLQQEVFRLDYPSNYGNPQQNWIFSNGN